MSGITGRVGAPGRYTWAGRPAAAGNSGKRITITDVGTGGGSEWVSDGTYWRPVNGAVVLVANGALSSHTGNTNKTTLKTYTIPAGLANIPGAHIDIDALWETTNDASNKNPLIEFGSTAIYSTAGASVATTTNVVKIRVRSATSQVCYPIGSPSQNSTQSGAVVAVSENLANALAITASCTLADGADTCSLHAWTITLRA